VVEGSAGVRMLSLISFWDGLENGIYRANENEKKERISSFYGTQERGDFIGEEKGV
jgi:hypothetical protein